jgi:hypothetical protein
MYFASQPPELRPPIPYVGHRHFRQKAVGRRLFLQSSAGATVLALGAGFGAALPASAAKGSLDSPTPIPGGTLLGQLIGFPNDDIIYHFYFPAFGQEASTVTDFDGTVAAAEIQGSGTGKDTSTGATSTLYYDADMRFMQGSYIGVDGKLRQSTFGFI